MEKPNIVLVDDEQEVLKALFRVFHKHYQVTPFTRAEDAIAAAASLHPVVVISDMRMPEMDGATFLGQAKQLWPDAERILLTGFADLERIVSAVNDAGLFAYLSKPWDIPQLEQTVAKAVEVAQLRQIERRLVLQINQQNQQLRQLNSDLESRVEQRTQALLENNNKLKRSMDSQRSLYQKTIELFTEMVDAKLHRPHGFLKKLALLCKALAERADWGKAEAAQVYLAALVHEFGVVLLSDEELSFRHAKELVQLKKYRNHAELGSKLLNKLPNFSDTAAVIQAQFENMDGSGSPKGCSGFNIPQGARALRLVKDGLQLLEPFKMGISSPLQDTLQALTNLAGKNYDPELVSGFCQMLEHRDWPEGTPFPVDSSLLKVGDHVADDVVLPNERTLFAAGHEISSASIEQLKQQERQLKGRFTLWISASH